MPFLIYFLLLLPFSLNATSLEEVLSKHHLSFTKGETSELLSQSFSEIDGNKIQRLLLSNKGDIFDLEVANILSRDVFLKKKKRDEIIFLNSFNPMIAPYSGKIGSRIECPKEFLPVQRKISFLGKTETAWIAKTTERKTYGVCSPSISFYDSAWIEKQMEDGVVYTLKVYTKEKSKKKIQIELLESLIKQLKRD